MLNAFSLFEDIGLLYFFLLPIFFEVGILNDYLDYKFFFKHERKFLTHSPVSPLLFLVAVCFGLLGLIISVSFWIFLSLTFLILFEIHLLLDSLNPTGIPLIFKNKKFTKIPYDNPTWNLIFVVIGIIFIGFSITLYFSQPI